MDMKTISASIGDIRAVISKFRHKTVLKQKAGEHYRLDRGQGGQYMTGHKKMEEKVYGFLRTLRAQNEPVVYVDICGRAKLEGADINYSFSLQENYWTFDQVPERFVGDIFSAKDFYGFLQMIRSSGFQPSFVTCEPVAGLNDYTPFWNADCKKLAHYEAILYQRLENNLRETVKLLRPGGFIFLTRILGGEGLGEFLAGVPQEGRQESLFMKSLCQSMRCSLDIESTVCGPAFLIRKRLR